MKVKDYIKELQKLNQEAEMIGVSSNYELRGALVPIDSVHQYNEGSKKTQTFRDDFDGETYDKETWSIVGGNLPVVLVS